MNDWLLYLHLVAAMVWLGGVAVLSVAGALVARSGDAALVGRFVRSLRVLGPAVLAPGALGTVAFGIWMAARGPWTFDQGWVRLALGLAVAAIALGAGVLARSAVLAQRAAAVGDVAEAVRRLRLWSWGLRAVLVLLLVIAWDMVFKPGL